MQLFIAALVSKCSLYQCSNVVAVTVGRVYTLEMATRAKTQLILILAEPERKFEKKRQSITITIRKTSRLLQTKGWSKSPSVPVQMKRFNNLCTTSNKNENANSK